MAGKINWDASFVPDSGDVYAEIYDDKGGVVLSTRVPCKPPINCQFPMEDVEYGQYRAGLALGGDRYYFVDGDQVITFPNQESGASTIVVSESNPTVSVAISVNLTKE